MPSEKTLDLIEKGTMEVNRWVSGTAGDLGSRGTLRTPYAAYRALSAQVYNLQKILKERLAIHLGWWLEINRFFLKVKLIYGPFLLFFFFFEPHKHTIHSYMVLLEAVTPHDGCRYAVLFGQWQAMGTPHAGRSHP